MRVRGVERKSTTKKNARREELSSTSVFPPKVGSGRAALALLDPWDLASMFARGKAVQVEYIRLTTWVERHLVVNRLKVHPLSKLWYQICVQPAPLHRGAMVETGTMRPLKGCTLLDRHMLCLHAAVREHGKAVQVEHIRLTLG